MYILKWKDGANCEQQFEHQGAMLKRVASILTIPPTDGKLEIIERKISSKDSIRNPDFEEITIELMSRFDREIHDRVLNLDEWLILEQRIEYIRGIIHVLKDTVNESKE